MRNAYAYVALPTPDMLNEHHTVMEYREYDQEQLQDRFEHQETGRLTSRIKGCVCSAHKSFQENSGLLYVVASQAFFSMMDTAVKKLHRIDPPVTTLQLMIVRMGFTFIFCMMYMYFAKIPEPLLGPKEVRLLLLSRGIGGSFGLFGLYYSLQYLSLSDATVLTFLVPSCVALAAYAFLNEVYTYRQALAGVVSLMGVVLIARPNFLFGESVHHQEQDVHYSASERFQAVGVALIGVMGSTVAYTSIRAIGKRAHPMHAMVAFSVQCVLLSGVGMIITGTPFVFPTRVEWLALLLLIGVFGFLAQILLTLGLQQEAAGRSTIAVYTQVIFAMILEYIFFRIYPPPLSLCGASMIIASALYVALSKRTADETTIPITSEEYPGSR